jgi:hypothetical protein
MSFHGLPWWNWALQGVGLVTSYVGAELNSRMNVRGFQVWMASNVCLFVLHAISSLWLLCVLDALYLRLNFRGVSRWRRLQPRPEILRLFERDGERRP